jgi:16S rRNA (cytosine1402-N4)-methyltransferase
MAASSALTHQSVLLSEAVDALVTDGDGTYVDATFGRGGHSRAVLGRLSERGRLIAFDRDPVAVASAAADPFLAADPRFAIEHTAFSAMTSTLAARGIDSVTGVLLDLGVSSPQIDDPERGFSFRFDGPLDMRMDTTRGESAAEFLARADERHIAEVIRDYGEERFALQVAKALVARREGGRPVRTTGELADVVARAVKTREAGQNPATRTFQALRIFVNAELEELEQALSAAVEVLAPGGRLVVISFHSLEDRIVKTFIAHESRSVIDRRAPFAAEPPHRLRALGRIKPGPTEAATNPRARSAVMRVAERTTSARQRPADDPPQRTAPDRLTGEQPLPCSRLVRVAAPVRRARQGAERGAGARPRQRAAQDRAALSGDAAARRADRARAPRHARGDAGGDPVRRVARPSRHRGRDGHDRTTR